MTEIISGEMGNRVKYSLVANGGLGNRYHSVGLWRRLGWCHVVMVMSWDMMVVHVGICFLKAWRRWNRRAFGALKWREVRLGWGGCIISWICAMVMVMVMVMMMCLSSFPSPTRCSSSGAALVVTFTILLFQFPSSTTSRCGTSNLVTSCLHWRVLQAIEIFTT